MTQGWKARWGARIMAALMVISAAALASCERKRHIVGSVNTEFKLIGPDHKIVIESYDDPKIDGITVFISKSQTGGIKGAIGMAEDTSDASVAVRQTGPIKVKETFENGEDAFTEKRSVLFKRLHVTRFWDAPHKSFVYVVWTDRFINGSPQNSISAVVAQPWGTQAPDLSLMKPAAAASPAAPQ
jgi:CreA protein